MLNYVVGMERGRRLHSDFLKINLKFHMISEDVEMQEVQCLI